MTQFDVLTNEIAGASEHVVVLDTGSSNFIPLVSYLKSGQVLEIFAELGRRVVIHSVLVGSAGGRETLPGWWPRPRIFPPMAMSSG